MAEEAERELLYVSVGFALKGTHIRGDGHVGGTCIVQNMLPALFDIHFLPYEVVVLAPLSCGKTLWLI